MHVNLRQLKGKGNSRRACTRKINTICRHFLRLSFLHTHAASQISAATWNTVESRQPRNVSIVRSQILATDREAPWSSPSVPKCVGLKTFSTLIKHCVFSHNHSTSHFARMPARVAAPAVFELTKFNSWRGVSFCGMISPQGRISLDTRSALTPARSTWLSSLFPASAFYAIDYTCRKFAHVI